MGHKHIYLYLEIYKGSSNDTNALAKMDIGTLNCNIPSDVTCDSLINIKHMKCS